MQDDTRQMDERTHEYEERGHGHSKRDTNLKGKIYILHRVRNKLGPGEDPKGTQCKEAYLEVAYREDLQESLSSLKESKQKTGCIIVCLEDT